MSTRVEVEGDVAVKTRDEVKAVPPKHHRVIYLNDDVTTMDFVVETLIGIFGHSLESAITLTKKVHEENSAVVAILPFEIAEHKAVEVTILARTNGFPLQVKVEPED